MADVVSDNEELQQIQKNTLITDHFFQAPDHFL